jgi:hypothetical protein
VLAELVNRVSNFWPSESNRAPTMCLYSAGSARGSPSNFDIFDPAMQVFL